MPGRTRKTPQDAPRPQDAPVDFEPSPTEITHTERISDLFMRGFITDQDRKDLLAAEKARSTR